MRERSPFSSANPCAKSAYGTCTRVSHGQCVVSIASEKRSGSSASASAAMPSSSAATSVRGGFAVGWARGASGGALGGALGGASSGAPTEASGSGGGAAGLSNETSRGGMPGASCPPSASHASCSSRARRASASICAASGASCRASSSSVSVSAASGSLAPRNESSVGWPASARLRDGDGDALAAALRFGVEGAPGGLGMACAMWRGVPTTMATSLGQRTLVTFVLDVSAPMGAAEGERSRLERSTAFVSLRVLEMVGGRC